MSSSSSSSLIINEEPLFDPNAFGMATLLGGLFLLGIASDMLVEDTSNDTNNTDDNNNSWWSTSSIAWPLVYLGFASIVCSLISFMYSFVYCFKMKQSIAHNSKQQPLINGNNHRSYGSVSSSSSSMIITTLSKS